MVIDLKSKIKTQLLIGNKESIREAIFEFDMQILSTGTFDDESVIYIIDLIDEAMTKEAIGAITLVNLFQSYWSKLSKKSQKLVTFMCNRHVNCTKCLGTQTAMCEILNGEYLQ